MPYTGPIVFLCHPYHRGGVTSWMAEIAKESARQQIKTYFVTVEPRSPFISSGNRPAIVELLGNNIKDNLSIISTPVGFEFELGNDIYKSSVYQQLILDKVPKGTPIVVSDDFAVWQAAALMANEYPMIGVLHSDEQAYYSLADRFMPYVSKFAAVSKRVAGKVNIPDLDIAVIPCGIKTDLFAGKSNTSKNEVLKIIWVGRVEEYQKRVSDIPLIVKKLIETGIPVQLKVLGTGPESDWLSASIESNGLQNQIEMLGWQSSSNIVKLLSESDLLLQTSNFEGMSVAVMEALAAGCGIVSSRVSGVEDYETDTLAANCMRLYEIGDINAAVLVITEMHKLERETVQQAAKQLAAKEFSIQACLQKYIHIIHDAVPSESALAHEPRLRIYIKSHFLAILRIVKYRLTHFNL